MYAPERVGRPEAPLSVEVLSPVIVGIEPVAVSESVEPPVMTAVVGCEVDPPVVASVVVALPVAVPVFDAVSAVVESAAVKADERFGSAVVSANVPTARNEMATAAESSGVLCKSFILCVSSS